MLPKGGISDSRGPGLPARPVLPDFCLSIYHGVTAVVKVAVTSITVIIDSSVVRDIVGVD